MLLRRLVVTLAIILSAFVAFIGVRYFSGNPYRVMQLLLCIFVGVMVVGFIWFRRSSKRNRTD